MKLLKSKLFKILLLGFVIIVGLGVAAYMFLMPADKPVQQSNNGPTDGVETIIPGYEDGMKDEEDGVDFTLSKPDGSDFTNIEDNVDNTLYTFEDGYAYALDPTTLEKIGPALDPITKEPVDMSNTEDENSINSNTNNVEQESAGYNIGNNTNNINENNTQQDAEQDLNNTNEQNQNNQEQDENKQVQDVNTKLPNTGIFLEDD